MHNNRQATMDADLVLKSIEQNYYQDEDQFSLEHLTSQFPEKLTSDYILDHKSKLERVLTVVTRKVSELVLSHQPAYVDELGRIAELQKSITESIRVCSQGRRCLHFIKDGTAKNGSKIVGHHQKRDQLSKLLDSLTAINELRKLVIEIRDLVDSQRDFPRAIQMCRDGQALLASFDKYKCCPSSDELISYINTQALNFFTAYHNSSVEELKMFLENESWDIVPVKSDFKLVHLKEFSFLRNNKCATSSRLPEDSGSGDLLDEQSKANNNNNSRLQELSPFNRVLDINNKETSEDLFGDDYFEGGSYFDQPDALPLDKISLSSDSDFDSELAKEYVEEDDDDDDDNNLCVGDHQVKTNSYMIPHEQQQKLQQQQPQARPTKISGPVLTNSSLNVLRLTGRYVQMMNVLSPISYEILLKIYKLLDHYTTFVYRKFGPESDKLNSVINSLRESLIVDDQTRRSIENATSDLLLNDHQHQHQHQHHHQASTSTPSEAKSTDRRNSAANSCSGSQAHASINPQKSIAIESLLFLVNQFWNLQEYLESLISPEQRAQLREQFSQSNSTIPDFLKARSEMKTTTTTSIER